MGALEGYQYVIAWGVYCLAGLGCCVFWWHLTSFAANRGWRDLLRGLVVVLIYTPWVISEVPGHFAPAIVVLCMDVFLLGSEAGLKGGLALLVTTFVMLLFLTVRQLLRQRPQDI